MKSSRVRQRIAQINGLQEAVFTEAFTRQHYVKIAALCKEHHAAPALIEGLAAMFAADNPSFDRKRFMDAAGY